MKRNYFDLSHEHKTTADFGKLIPVCCEEVLPGDTFNAQTSLLARVAPTANPIMHDVDIRVHHWYVPNRIIFDEWDEWITGEDAVTAMPTVQASSSAEEEILDRLGMYPTQTRAFNALPVRAYNKIWNEYYRDQDLQTAVAEDTLAVQNICWEKDYFTTCRATPQQGSAVELGFSSGEAPVRGIGLWSSIPVVPSWTTTGDVHETGGIDSTPADSDGDRWERLETGAAVGAVRQDASNLNYPKIYADMSALSGGIDLDELRNALALQRFAEARSRFGSRYEDYLRYLGVNPSDGRLNRPEFLGGGKDRINFSEVLATAASTGVDIGDMYGHGIAGMRSRRYRKMFEEHGWVLSLMSVRPRTVYMNSVPRKFTRTDPMDYWQKELEIMPWQEVKESEVYEQGSTSTTFGYAPRYEEYRHGTSYVSGSFRDSGTEEDWHFGRKFASAPTLNSDFVKCAPTDRVFQDTSMPEVIVNAYNSIRAARLVRRSASLTGI